MHALGFHGMDLVCVCGRNFGSRKREAVLHAKTADERDEIELRKAKRKADRAALLAQRLSHIDGTAKSTRELAILWGISKSGARRYLMSHQAWVSWEYADGTVVWSRKA